MPDASYPKPISVPTDPSRTSQGASSVGGVEKYGMIDAEGLPGDAININASLITRGTLSGRNVQSTSGGDRIILNNGNYLQFFRGGTLRAQLRGNSTSGGGIVQELGNYIIRAGQGHGFLTESTTTGSYFSFFSAGSNGVIGSPVGNIISFRNSSGTDKISLRIGSKVGRVQTTDGLGNYYWLPYVFSQNGSNANRPVKMSTLHLTVSTILGFGQVPISLGAKFWDKERIYVVGQAIRTTGGTYTPADWNVGIESLTQNQCLVQVCHRARPLGGSHFIKVRLLVVGQVDDARISY